MNTLRKKCICPYCFHTITAQDMLFRCMNPVCPGQKEDQTYSKTRNEAIKVKMGRVLLPTRLILPRVGLPRAAKCDICTDETHTSICRYCHFELGSDLGQTEQRMIAIIGGPGVGKSHYIASLIQRLRNKVGPDFHITISMLDEGTSERWTQGYYQPLFIERKILPPTQLASINSQTRSPLIFRLILSKGTHRHAVTISFFDTAGEDLSSLSTMSVQNRYILHADGLIFLLDPLQIPDVRSLNLPSIQYPKEDFKNTPEDIVMRLRAFFEREKQLKPTEKIQVPVAFTLSKIDVFANTNQLEYPDDPLFESTSVLHQHSPHEGSVDLSDISAVNADIKTQLKTWSCANLEDLIQEYFEQYSYFGISSLGRSPDKENKISQVEPLRVEDPFLWLLYKFNLITNIKNKKP